MGEHGSQAEYYNNHAALYADPKIRPTYPPEIFNEVFQFAGSHTDVALDVATGSGQCARELATRYQQVGIHLCIRLGHPAPYLGTRSKDSCFNVSDHDLAKEHAGMGRGCQ